MISPNVRYQTTDTGISENAKQGKCQILNLSILFYYFQNIENQREREMGTICSIIWDQNLKERTCTKERISAGKMKTFFSCS